MSESTLIADEEALLGLLDRDSAYGETFLGAGADIEVDFNGMEAIDALLATLSEQEFSIVDQFFGLSGEAPLGFEEIADLSGLTPEEVRDTIERALQTLRSAGVVEERQLA